MNKITKKLDSPAKIAAFAVCGALIVVIIVFTAIKAGAGVNTNKAIGMDKGVNIALDDAGMKAEQVTNLTAKYDTEDGVSIYEVDFNANGCKYEYEIKASDGTILEAKRKTSVSRDAESNETSEPEHKTESESGSGKNTASGAGSNTSTSTSSGTNTNSGASSGNAGNSHGDSHDGSTSAGNTTSSPSPVSSYIGVDKAKSIALKHAGLSASSVTFTKAKLDREDGIRIYEIEFYSRTQEYEYEIKATNGKILDFDVEALDDDDWDDDWDDDRDDD